MENKDPEKSTKEGEEERNDAVHADQPKTGEEGGGSAPEDHGVKERDGEAKASDAKEGENADGTEGDVEKVLEEGVREEIGEEAPPEIHYTLESLSEELDQFLSTLSAGKNEHRGGDGAVEVENADGYLQIPQFVGKFLDLVEEKLARYDSGESRMKWSQVPEEDSSLLEAVDRVSKLLGSLKGIKSCLDHHGPLINHAGSIQQRAMAFLEDEFRILLEDSITKEPIVADENNNNNQKKRAPEQDQNDTVPVDEENPGGDGTGIDYPGYQDNVVSVLRKIADQMIGGGYGPECREVYLVARRNILMQTLKDQEFEKVSIDEVQKMNWETLEREIPIWNKTFKDCSTVYFPGELKLAEHIFPEDHGDLFSIITHGLAIQFLGFAEAVAMTKRSTEKLFKMLDIYETLRDNFPAMESLFPEEFRSELKTEVTSARSRLGETAIFIFSDLENSIKSDSSKTPVPGGAVHPLTRYTMNYLKYSCEYKDTLEQVFKEHSKIERADSTSRPRNYEGDESNNNRSSNNSAGNGKHENEEENSSPFSSQQMRIMDLLDSNLEAKSKLYRDVSLSCIFMMNNGRYIVQKIKGSPEIHQVMGDTWCRRRSSDLRNYHKNYQRETWGKLLGFLGHEGLMNNGKIVKPNLKERFKSFNATFDEIHKTQSSWVVNDEQLQSELRVSISAVMIPAYRSFLGRFAQYLDPGRQTEKYIKYQPEDIEDLIDELFDGNTSSSTMARRRT